MRNATALTLAILLIAAPLFSQSEKGVNPVQTQNSKLKTQNSTRAVVIGISDYQEKEIPDLRFADRDAEAFANFLRSPGGGSLGEENLRVLTNQKATAGQVIAALTWLLDESKPGDQAIIYFSGHGDVEAKLLNQLGFLLLWDSPARVYLAGALPVDMLRQVVSTLSIELKTRVFVVVDACRAGKLAGNTVIGTQLTSNQLAQQFSAEQKILSCQPNEFSIEGEQWGGGRGVFSYHLCNGLYGLADGDRDGQVSLFEIGRYLEDRVPNEVAPLSQMPLTVGDKSTPLFSVDVPTLTALQKQGTPPTVIAKVEQRGIEKEVLAKVDSSIHALFLAFKKAVEEKRFFSETENGGRIQNPSTVGQSADELYAQLSQNQTLAPLHGIMKRNYAAALQDDAQQAMNIWLKADVQQLECTGKNLKIKPIPRQLERAADLLGAGHYMYRSLQARKLLFEGILQQQHMNPDEALGQVCLSIFRQSLSLEPLSPHPWHRMSQIYWENLRMPDSAFACARKAGELAPNWVLPLVDLGYKLTQKDKLVLAKQALLEAEAIDPTHPYVVNRWAVWFKHQSGKANAEKALSLFEKYRKNGGATYSCWHNDYAVLLHGLGKYLESEAEFKINLSVDSTNVTAWSNLGSLYTQTRRYAEAELVLKKAIALDTAYSAAWNYLGTLYTLSGRHAEAEAVFVKTIALDSTDANAWNNLGHLYNQARRYAEAVPVLKKTLLLDSTNVIPCNNLGVAYLNTRHFAEAELVLKKATLIDSTFFTAWANLGNLYLQTRRYTDAEPVFLKTIALDSANTLSWNNLGFVYLNTQRFAKAEPFFKKAIAIDSNLSNPRRHLGIVFFKTNRPEEARQNFLKALELNPNYAAAMLGMAYLLHSEGKIADAIQHVEQAILKNAPFEQLENDPDLAPLRALPDWKILMKKHFPEKVKD